VYCNIIKAGRARACRELCKNTHVQIFELIEESLIQIHGLCCSLCIDVDMLMNVCFLLYICFICCVCDFMLSLESERKKE
jgi:hypothetical protein